MDATKSLEPDKVTNAKSIKKQIKKKKKDKRCEIDKLLELDRMEASGGGISRTRRDQCHTFQVSVKHSKKITDFFGK